MGNNSYWFKHDDNARRDPKLTKLRRIKGMKGIGIYWCLIEILHEQGGQVEFGEIGSIAFELQEDEINVLSVIKEFDLFVIRGQYVGNTRVSESIQERSKKSKIGRSAVEKRWGKKLPINEVVNTNVLPKPYVRNTIRGDKRREEKIFIAPTIMEVIDYFKEKGYSEFGARKAFDHYNEADWHDTHGKPVLSWKQKMSTNWLKEEFKIKGAELPMNKKYKEVTSKDMFPDA